MLIPLGSWCRTAFQIAAFASARGLEQPSYVFDWTITPFASLSRVLSNDFEPAAALTNDKLRLSRFGSIVDADTQLIFHHSLSPQIVDEIAGAPSTRPLRIPDALYESKALSHTRGRFLHAYDMLLKVRNTSAKVGFVRWIRHGHPDAELPSAFENESPEALRALLSEFMGHSNFSVLHLSTELTGDDPADSDAIKEYSTEGTVTTAVLRERRSLAQWDFRGDSRSWSAVLSRFLSDHQLTLATPTT